MSLPGAESIDVSYAHDGERGQYLCALLRSRLGPLLQRELDGGERAVRRWYARLNCVELDFSDQRECFRNLNRLD